MALVIYRRHRTKCPQRGTGNLKSCECAIWLVGTLFGERYRASAKTRNFKAAEKQRAKLEQGEEPKLQQPKNTTIKDALSAFISDCEARKLNRSTRSKYKLLQDNLAAFAERNHLIGIAELQAEDVRRFRQERSLGARTASKELERIRCFFNFCISNEWIAKNPAKSIKAPQVKPKPTLPYSALELGKIFEHADFRSATFYKLLLHSGLRILDASTMRPERIQDGKLFIYQAKTGQPVWVPLPPDLVQDLGKLTLVGGYYFAVESEKPESIAEYYRKKIHKIQDGFHAHRFRDTFAVNLLQAGVPLEEVSILLGHSSVKITEQHYAPWVASRQTRLEELVKRTWKTNLALVKK